MKLRQLRLQKEITQLDLEVLTSMPAQKISLIERGYRQPTLIEKIMDPIYPHQYEYLSY